MKRTDKLCVARARKQARKRAERQATCATYAEAVRVRDELRAALEEDAAPRSTPPARPPDS